MNIMVRIVWMACLSLFATSITAQKIFSEGSVRYDVYVDGSAESNGVYVISVKGGMIKRELAMNNGYNNITIYNQKNGKTLSLNVNEDQKYALEISEEELKEKNKRFEHAVLTPTSNTKKIAGFSCSGMKVQYDQVEGNEIFYTSDLVPLNESINTMFPGLKGLALEYETKLASKGTMRFVAKAIEIKSLDNNQFVLPTGYKIVTKEELKNMK